jgi:hypothetical protein
MDDVLSSAIRDATYGWLTRLETLIHDADLPSRAALAETETSRLIRAWRGLLAEHEPDQNGRCRRCSGWRRHRAFPCSVWVTAHRYLVVTEAAVGEVGRHETGARQGRGR